ncbi:type I restriction endonuclease subunit R [Corynebacterium coyleae]|uniref:type I restriction endonuclease subunit R n=1 Tax=Corynebacterium coyleae TaxID=53374 RepID=UPI00254AA4EF|nr:type I restriction endonuclease subunit R [Corynebacterium coyleae]MDK8241629.1 type I restriction endonuclease subunit R [Corynebacterium coyleae]
MTQPTTPGRVRPQDVGAKKPSPLIASTGTSTVLAQFKPDDYLTKAANYQTESQLEQALIEQLGKQGYEYRPDINDNKSLKSNIRTQLEKINKYAFSDSDWERFYVGYVSRPGDGIVEKTRFIQDSDGRVDFETETGQLINITLLDKANIHNNRLQVINQYKTDGKSVQGEKQSRKNRYDVTVLINGLPMVHIELKKRGVELKQAFNQINRYSRDSFWADDALFEYVQLYVISNGTRTKYYSNTTREQQIKANDAAQSGKAKKTAQSFEFTSFWADWHNKSILDLMAFAQTFFYKHTLLNVLTKYCVFNTRDELLVLRPYQIAAAEEILTKIETSTNHKQLSTTEGGGYIWHTTGSGKTLTSFKTAQLASKLPQVDKVVFVVDRKDLDYQTMREYDTFQKGAANSNTSTRILRQQLSTKDELIALKADGEQVDFAHADAKIVITTIQKLSNLVNKQKKMEIYNKHVVFIFDECHRSQFGLMHDQITKKFKQYNMFGFTGTPIFEQNSTKKVKLDDKQFVKTTQQAFGNCLHQYTIVDAIGDNNVLPFKVEYHNVLPKALDVESGEITEVNTRLKEEELRDPARISEIVAYILQVFDRKTKRYQGKDLPAASFDHKVVENVEGFARKRNKEVAQEGKRRVRGFNAMFATASIEAAMAYYDEFKAQQANLPEAKRLKVATIFSASAGNTGESEELSFIDDEGFETQDLSSEKLDFLAAAVEDYNEQFKTNYDARDSESFENYYKDLSQRIKNREVDLVIVVNMFLTGFDAQILNTLFVDKNLRQHGLIQAFSRTNRILNAVKAYGDIVCFRNLDKATNEALELFGNADNARQVAILAPFGDFYEKYARIVEELKAKYPIGELIISESGQKEFVQLYSEILKLENVLVSFDEFGTDESPELLTPRENQDYKSTYLDLYQSFKARTEMERVTREGDEADGVEDTDDSQLVFELELIKQVEINVDYILLLVEKMREDEAKDDNNAAQLTRETIAKQLDASPTLRPSKDLFTEFLSYVSNNDEKHDPALEDKDEPVGDKWVRFITRKREEEADTLIAELKLRPEAAQRFISEALQEGVVESHGTAIAGILPRTRKFGAKANHGAVKQKVVERLQRYIERFGGLSS